MLHKSSTIVLSIALAAVHGSAEDASSSALRPVTIVCVDDEATAYATFQSHNQKVISNRRGIFMTYIRSRNKAYTAQSWRMLRSTDGGKTFTVVYEGTHATNPPVLETDERGNIYLMRVDMRLPLKDKCAYLYRFSTEKDFREPAISMIPRGAGGKFAMMYDPRRDQLYFLRQPVGQFFVIGSDGRVKSARQLVRTGPDAKMEYPLFSLDPDGTLHVAWTAQRDGKYLYWSIHHMLSPDGGESWRNLAGATLSTPVTADQTGPSLRVTLDDEFEYHTWLANFMVKAGKVHFVYWAQTKPRRQHYVRYDVATAKRDQDRQAPELRGKAIGLSGLDGFLASRSRDPGSALYCVMQDQGHIACLVSDDNGDTWRDYARSEERFRPYSIGGCREITDDGYIIGSFTHQVSNPQSLKRDSKVYFLKIKAE